MLKKGGDCANFIKDLLSRVASDKNPLVEGGDILKVYDLINSPSQGGMVRAGAPGSVPGANFALGSIKGGNATIQIGITIPGPPTAKGDAIIALHETIHHTGQVPYSDEELAKAVYEQPDSPTLGEPPAGSTPTQIAYFYSNYWNTELKNHCK
jgi:hypothetical protein